MQELPHAAATSCGDVPQIFGLRAVPTLYPGTYKPGTLRNLIRAGRGPAHFKHRGRIFLRHADFLAWLLEETGHAGK